MNLSVIILAAGQGKRMNSALPKVLHPLAGKPLLEHVVETAQQLGADNIHIVYGYGGDTVPSRLKHLYVHWVQQAEQLGTGHAVAQATPQIEDGDRVLVLYGDVPLVKAATLQKLVLAAGDDLGLLTVSLEDPTGYGRILRDDQGAVLRIVENKDCSPDELRVTEINTGILVAGAGRLHAWLDRLDNNNAQGEFYLTDIIALAVSEGVKVNTLSAESPSEVMGINDKTQLAELERRYQRTQAERLMMQGVTLHDPARFDLRGQLCAGSDVSIDINVIIEGGVTLGDGVKIGSNCCIRNARIGDGTEVLPNTVIEDAIIGPDCRIGPFARIRPETRLAKEVHIGNFVEIKKSGVGQGSKVNHLSYIGDTTVGREVNIGAGTITCNYDGADKHRTLIGDGAFIGSDTQLVAPVEVGANATIGAGSTITHDAPPDKLTLSRSRQATVEGWERPTKKKR